MKEYFPYPSALFEIGHQYKWKARFLVGVGYLYTLCHDEDVASTSYAELQKVMVTESKERINEVLKYIEAFSYEVNKVLLSSGQIDSLRFVTRKRGRKPGIILGYLSPHDLKYLCPNNLLFPVPKLAFLLPVSVQAKAIYVYLWYMKSKSMTTPKVSFREIAKVLRLCNNKIRGYVSELEELRIIQVEQGKNGKKGYCLKPCEDWDRELFSKVAEIYGESHPFLEDAGYEGSLSKDFQGKGSVRLTIELQSDEQRNAAIVVLKEYFGDKVKIFQS